MPRKARLDYPLFTLDCKLFVQKHTSYFKIILSVGNHTSFYFFKYKILDFGINFNCSKRALGELLVATRDWGGMGFWMWPFFPWVL